MRARPRRKRGRRQPPLRMLAISCLFALSTVSSALATAPGATTCRSSAATKIGAIRGIVLPRARPGATKLRCSAATLGTVGETPPASPYIGTPPLSYHLGAVLGTSSTVTLTPIYWAPSPFVYPSNYKSLTEQFLNDVAASSGSSTNVFSVLRQYTEDRKSVV